MSKKTAARAAAISAALAKLSNSWDRRKQRKRDEAYDAMRKQLAEGQLRERQYEESTRPTIEQRMAQLQRGEEMEGLNLEGRRLDIEGKRADLKRAQRPPERRTFKEIAADIGVGADEQYAATEALEASGNDFDKAIASLAGPGPARDGEDDSIDATGTDPRQRGRLLLQRARREWAASGGDEHGGASSPGAARKRTEAQVDAVSMRSAMQANAMIQNPNAPFEERANSWLTLERLGMLKAPQEVHDWVRYGAQTQQQVADIQQAKAPPAHETRVPRPIRMSATTTGEDRAAIERRRMNARHSSVSGRPPEARELMDFLSSGKSRLAPTSGPMNDYPPGMSQPGEPRRVQGAPYRKYHQEPRPSWEGGAWSPPKYGPENLGVTPEQSRQLDINAILESQREIGQQYQQGQSDPLQAMFDQIRNLRESLKGAQSTMDPNTRGKGF